MASPAHDARKADEFLSDVHIGCPPGNGLLRSRFLLQQRPADTPVSVLLTLAEIEVEEDFSPDTASDGDLEVRRRPRPGEMQAAWCVALGVPHQRPDMYGSTSRRAAHPSYAADNPAPRGPAGELVWAVAPPSPQTVR